MASSDPSTERMALMRRAYHLYHVERMSIRKIAHELGLIRDDKPQFGKVQRMVADYGERWRVVDELRQRLEVVENRVIQLETEAAGMYRPSARDDTDWDEWSEIVRNWQQLPRMIRGQTHYDMHIPDDSKQATALRLAINEIAQPDFAVLGSDAFDFDVLSLKYPRMYTRRDVDPFEEVRATYDDFVTRLIEGNPNVVLVAIGDNHGQQRVEKFINEAARVFGDRLTADYNELIRSKGRVLWLGWVQEFRLEKSLFEHGKKAAANAALSNVKFRGSTTADIGGHVHRITQHISMNEDVLEDGTTPWHFPTVSVTTGAGCNIPPHYITDTKATGWVNGTAVVDINLHGMDVHIQNLLFHPRRNRHLATVFGEHRLVVDENAQLVQPAIEQKAKAAA